LQNISADQHFVGYESCFSWGGGIQAFILDVKIACFKFLPAKLHITGISDSGIVAVVCSTAFSN
jgi:hypothetical protein